MTDSTATAAPGPLAGLGIVLIVVVAVIAWAIIGTALFSDLTLFGGFLLLWHWANLEALEIKRLPATIAGALVGIGLAWQVVYLTGKMGSNGMILGLLIMVAAIYLQVIAVLPFLFNAAAMLFLTVAAAPLIQLKIDFAELALATVVGGLFFGVFVEAIKRIAAKFMPAAG
ncbi:hypothetical protein [Novosphingobium ginsenosidimutans]|uniref:DUF1097 domain-containing protein n=1 Tax=Novosphingobium ginsenosidimutans TaxID=1176536 RepID=A0A5B8SAA0_9SPHN|nr:hypothetical protein [Novosphingobium ginsenosidimutans]QEA17185.1 hypothetical protein FRF71_14155 [Novosphingobium ginsenosidimutans]